MLTPRSGIEDSGFTTYKLGTLNKASTALFIVSYVAIVAITAILSFSVSAAEPGEKRILTVGDNRFLIFLYSTSIMLHFISLSVSS
jgi:hypothetical protein